ncbi:MAG TPA: OPT family oligopeptide transporter, partial [Candidatus Eisenbacteria bacterium]|nr:OPT family oligopeptide transporter [Candidatus Eisenbacteria bacterium]
MTTETVAEAPARPVEAAPPPQTPEQIERHWFENVYAGDRMRQLTPRALIMGMALGAFMSLSNIYIGLKAGWSMGVAITSCILAYAIFAALHRALPKQFPAFSILENNAMQSCASAAGYMTGAGLVNAIPALMMLNPQAVPGMWALTIWTLVLSWLGVFLAVPAKRQMINVEQLPYPSGIAATTTMRALHSEGSKAEQQAKALMWSGILGAAITWFRDATAPWIKYPNIPATWGTNWIHIGRHRLNELTMSFEGSLLFVAAGAIMGFRQAWSMMLGACVNYLVLAPIMMDHGVIAETGGSALRRISSWSLWIGVPMMVTSGLLLFFMQWRTVVRAFGTLVTFLKKRAGAADDPMERIEVPGSWFVGGMIVLGGAAIYLGHLYFHIHWWMGLIAVLMTFFLVVVAARATGETDITPTGPISKITQLTFGAIQPGNVTTNLMTANITAGAVSHAGDLLTDLKSGYLLGANPRQQFIAQFFGVLAGGLVVVPVFFLLVPNASVLGTEQWPAPAAQVWRGVAELLSKGVGSLHPTARIGLLVGSL